MVVNTLSYMVLCCNGKIKMSFKKRFIIKKFNNVRVTQTTRTVQLSYVKKSVDN